MTEEAGKREVGRYTGLIPASSVSYLPLLSLTCLSSLTCHSSLLTCLSCLLPASLASYLPLQTSCLCLCLWLPPWIHLPSVSPWLFFFFPTGELTQYAKADGGSGDLDALQVAAPPSFFFGFPKP